MERYPKTWIGFALDLTERKAVEGALHEAKEAAESASRAKDQFLAMLSHELRTPLTPVLLMATAMLDDPATPAELRPMLELTRRNVELDARLIDDLLDITRISRGKLQLNREVVDAHALLDQALEICRDDIRAGNLRLELDLSAAAHHVDGDPARLQQVFWNLIKNAVKFTPSGGRLAIRSFNRDEGTGKDAVTTLLVEVSDTGIGIEPHVLPRIFDAFEQGDASTRRRSGGLGLGLAISRSVVVMHGGHLTASSDGKDQGSTFTLELATTPAPVPDAHVGPTAPSSGAYRRPLRILLVEDNKETLRYLSWILTQHEHVVSTADTMTSALALARNEAFDLIISDIELPDGSGLELMQSLGGSGSIPAIALSGFGSDDDVQLSKAAGFSEHLTKPVDFLKLEATIHHLTSADAAHEIAR
jgi:nitrogen-specific signal transduction histidine kinase/CheY-like chemotaxis protein